MVLLSIQRLQKNLFPNCFLRFKVKDLYHTLLISGTLGFVGILMTTRLLLRKQSTNFKEQERKGSGGSVSIRTGIVMFLSIMGTVPTEHDMKKSIFC